MADDVWAWCEKAGASGRTVTVKVKFADFRQITRSRSYPIAVTQHEQLRQASLDLIRTVLSPVLGIRDVGVTVSNYESLVSEHGGLPLFSADPGMDVQADAIVGGPGVATPAPY